MASWDLGGLASLIYRAQSSFWSCGLGHAPLALRGSHGESPGHQSVEVRKKKDLKISTEPERQYLVLGCTEISIEMLMAPLFPSLHPACLGN